MPVASPPVLKYRFVVSYQDGSSFIQNPEDKSIRDPLRSAYYDAVTVFNDDGSPVTAAGNNVQRNDIALFALLDQKDKMVGCVDLQDGHFEIRDTAFKLHSEFVDNFRLVFFRHHRHDFTHTVNKNKQIVSEKRHDTTYRIGWKAKDQEGNTVERIIEIL